MIASVLSGHGCKVKWQANREAHIAADAAAFAGYFLANAIAVTGQAVGKGVRYADSAVVSSEIIPTKSVEMPPAAKTGASLARKATLTMANATTVLASGLATAASAAAATAHEHMPDCSEQWQEDAKVVGKSALEAGVVVWQAVQDTTMRLGADVAEASAGLVGHRYGEEAGAATRDSFHAVGNVYLASANLSIKGAAQTAAAGSAQGLARSIDQGTSSVEAPCAEPSIPRQDPEQDVLRAPCTEAVDDKDFGY